MSAFELLLVVLSLVIGGLINIALGQSLAASATGALLSGLASAVVVVVMAWRRMR